MSRPLVLALLALFAFPTLAAKKNVVLFVADDHGAEALGCYGNRVVKTPNLDALAEDGTRFTSAFCTTASCSASRSVILTGIHNHRTGQYGHEHEYHHFSAFPNIKTLPVMLEEAGYRTARGGKFHVGPEEVFKFGQVFPPAQLERFIDADKAKPFFYYFCTNEPHRPFNHDPEDRVDPKDVIVPAWLPDLPETREELALYYASIARVDKAMGRIVATLKKTGVYDDTLVIYLSDNGGAFPGSKTNLYDPGMRLPCIVKLPGAAKRGGTNDAMVSWVDLTPTILEFVGVPSKSEAGDAQPVAPGRWRNATPGIQGRSFLSVVDQEKPEGWDEIFASHTFHEITMYYPMRVVRTRTHKLIWNIAHPLPYPFASDLHASKVWQAVLSRNLTDFGPRLVKDYLQRPRFELYDLTKDPLEVNNLAKAPENAKLLEELQGKMKAFQKRTQDPWVLKWDYE